jgi:hypothetical protein
LPTQAADPQENARAPCFSFPASNWLTRICGLTVAALALFWAALLPFAAPWEYAEGDCATWIWMLRHGEPLYGAAAGITMRKSNYPPLFLQVAAWLSPSDAAILAAGRLVSLAGFGLAAAMVAVCTRRATGSSRAAAAAAVILGGTAWFGLWAAICRPDALAVGLGAAGVTCVALRVRGWPLLAAACFAASLMAKHSLIVFPLGAIGWALLRERRAGFLLAAATSGLVAAAVAAGGLWEPLVRNSIAGWVALRFLENAVHYAAPLGLGIALSLGLLRRWPSLPEEARRVAGPWLCVLAVGLPWTVSLGRVGASYNYVFELACAVSVLAPLAVAAGGRASLLVGHAAIALAFTLQSVIYQLAVTRPRAAAELSAASAALEGVSGAVLSEQSAYALSSGHPAVVVPFLAAQLAAAGRWDARPLVLALRRGEISRVLLEFSADDADATKDGDHGDRFPPEVLSAVRARYQLDRQQGELRIYKPR